MGKASRTKQSTSRRDRIAAQRAADRRREVRNRILIASGAVVVVIAIVVVFVVVKATGGNSSKPASSANGPTGSALAAVVHDTTTVPASTLESVGAGSVTTPPAAVVNGTPLTSGGKPEMLYVGAEYCPYCAFERWGMVVALSRFGTFKNLSTTHSSSTDAFPNTATWTFYKSTYTSKYLVFTPVEETTNVPDSSSSSGYTPLQSPTAAQEALLTKYDAPPYVSSADAGAIPFVYLGGHYVINGASASPQVLQGKTWSQIASSLQAGTSAQAKAILGTANFITSAICKMTSNQPSNVCTSTITGLQSSMKAPS
jgi:Domain of unknown function (DUF929)